MPSWYHYVVYDINPMSDAIPENPYGCYGDYSADPLKNDTPLFLTKYRYFSCYNKALSFYNQVQWKKVLVVNRWYDLEP